LNANLCRELYDKDYAKIRDFNQGLPKVSFRFSMPLFGPLFFVGLAFGSTFHVSNGGNDAASGTAQAPFKTLAKAASLLRSGDTCLLHGGVYRETFRPSVSGTPTSPIVLAGAPGETAILSGCDSIGNWTMRSDSIWFAPAPLPVSQLFQDQMPMPEARFPNSGRNIFRPGTIPVTMDSTSLTSSAFPPLDRNWIGATVWAMIGLRWVAQSATVTGVSSGALTITGNSYASNTGDGIGYLSGVLAALDTAGEWLWKNDTLYFKPDAGKQPNQILVEGKTRTWALDLSSRTDVVVQDLSIFGAAANLNQSKRCRLQGLSMRYLSHFISTVNAVSTSSWTRHEWTNIKYSGMGIGIFGDSNIVKNCSLQWSAGDGITLYGNGNLVENNTISNVDYSGSDCNGISMHGKGHRVTRNTVDSCGRGCIFLAAGTTASQIDHNHVFANGLRNWDVGGIYTFGNDAAGTSIDHNWVHDSHSSDSYQLGMGIYVDNFVSNLSVHHNVVWNCDYDALNYSRPAVNILWANNTVFAAKNVTYSYLHPDASVDSSYGNRLWNNLMTTAYATSSSFDSLNQSHNVRLSALPLRDPANFDFRLNAGASAVDSGLAIPGITDGYLGRAPDVGAYELGGIWWKAGAGSRDDSSEIAAISGKTVVRAAAWRVAGSRVTSSSGVTLDVVSLDGRNLASFVLAPGASKDLSGLIHGAVLIRGSGWTRKIALP